MTLSTALQKIGYWVVLGLVFLTPLFFLPITPDFYDFNKNYLLVGSTLILLILWAIISVVERQVRIVRSPLGLPILAVVAAWLASAILRSPNRVEAFLLPGQAGTWLALGLFYLASLSFIRTKKEVDGVIYALVGSLATLATVSLLWSSNLAVKLIPSLPAYLNSELWNPSGSLLAAAVALGVSLPLVGWIVIKQKAQQTASILLSLALLVIVIGLGGTVYRLINPISLTDRVTFLPYITGWGIALETLKSSPILGTGPDTFLADFTRFRPVTFNLTPQWSLRFITSSNYYLHLLTVLGIAGFAAYLFLVSRTYKLVAKIAKLAHNSSAPHSQIVAFAAGSAALFAFVLQLFLPINFLFGFLTVVFIIIMVASLKQLGTSSVAETGIDLVAAGSNSNSSILPWVVLTLVLLLAGPTVYLGGRAYAAEISFYQGIQAANRNDGRTTYTKIASAITTNPYLDTYRVAFSRTNLLLASSLANNPNLSDSDRAMISQLIQQAIREAKNAVALNSLRVTNVENLAIVYRNLLNFADGAQDWTVASYQQAIALDPTNPNLRIALGGVYYGQKNWDEAIRFFQQAVDLKPNLANAYYNLAAAHKQKGSLTQAVAAMQRVVQLTDPATSDYDKAVAELADLQKQVGPTAPVNLTGSKAKTELTIPEPLPTPALNPPIELDQSLSPETPATPSTETNP
ncbi:MAG: tetratricopeptide repeat protein [bacterium]|nr:tetratricopeptide repeat protein [bacterium]